MLESKLDTQNKEIEKLKIDTKKYIESKAKQKQEISDKYERVVTNTKKYI